MADENRGRLWLRGDYHRASNALITWSQYREGWPGSWKSNPRHEISQVLVSSNHIRERWPVFGKRHFSGALRSSDTLFFLYQKVVAGGQAPGRSVACAVGLVWFVSHSFWRWQAVPHTTGTRLRYSQSIMAKYPSETSFIALSVVSLILTFTVVDRSSGTFQQ